MNTSQSWTNHKFTWVSWEPRQKMLTWAYRQESAATIHLCFRASKNFQEKCQKPDRYTWRGCYNRYLSVKSCFVVNEKHRNPVSHHTGALNNLGFLLNTHSHVYTPGPKTEVWPFQLWLRRQIKGKLALYKLRGISGHERDYVLGKLWRRFPVKDPLNSQIVILVVSLMIQYDRIFDHDFMMTRAMLGKHYSRPNTFNLRAWENFCK